MSAALKSNEAVIQDVANLAHISFDEAKRVVNAVFKTMYDALIRGESIEIRGFGSFKPTKLPPRYFYANLFYKVEIYANHGRRSIRFKPAKELLYLVNKEG